MVGRLGQGQEFLGFFIPLLRLLFQLGLRQGDDGDLGGGEKGVDQDQQDQNQKLRQ